MDPRPPAQTARPVFRRLLAGAALALAIAPGALAQNAEHWDYKVERGDTLIGISKELLAAPERWRDLQQINRIAQPRRLPTGHTLRIPLAWMRADAAVASVVTRSGSVQLLRDGAAARALVAGDELRSADTVQTGADATALVELADGTRVLVTPRSRLTLQQLLVYRGSGQRASVLQLHDGGAETRVRPDAPRPHFEIRTPVLTLGVRGTEFRTHLDAATQRARAEVTQGRVAAAGTPGSAATTVEAGFGIVGSAAGLGTPKPLLPAPDLSALPARIERLPLQLGWRGDAAAVGWRAQVLDGASPPQLLRDGRFERAQAHWGDLPDGTYRLRVRAIDADGLEGRDAEAPFTLKARPEPPLTIEPRSDARSYGPVARWRWSLSSAAASYRLQVADNPGFQAPVIDRPGLPGPGVELALEPGRWHWRLASVRADGDQGPWGDAQVFEQREVPPAPSTAAPQIGKDELVLRWSARQPGDRYQFQLARDAGFAELLTDRTVDQPEAVLAPPPPGRYWLRVRTLDPDGYAGPWAAPSELQIPAEPVRWWIGPALLLLLLLL